MKSEVLTDCAVDVHLHFIISLLLGILSVNENQDDVEDDKARDDENQVEC